MATASLVFSSAAALSRPEQQLEDPLSHLPCSTLEQYRKGEIIYGQEPPTRLYLVMEGSVKISRVGLDGSTLAVIGINWQDELFGESALLKLSSGSEEATALENTKIMSWPISDIEELVVQRPRLGLALLQVGARRTLELGQRIESFANDMIIRRLARALLGFSERFAITAQDDGSVRIPPFTHQLLAEYVGTSREIVTHYLNQLRRDGYLRYSRKGMVIYRTALQNWLNRRGVLE